MTSNIIRFCGFMSLLGLMIFGTSALVSIIWDAEFLVKVSATGVIVCVVLFVAAIIATNSPLYRD